MRQEEKETSMNSTEVEIFVLSNGVDRSSQSSSKVIYTYVALPLLENLQPTSGNRGIVSNTLVTVTGGEFFNTTLLSCRFISDYDVFTSITTSASTSSTPLTSATPSTTSTSAPSFSSIDATGIYVNKTTIKCAVPPSSDFVTSKLVKSSDVLTQVLTFNSPFELERLSVFVTNNGQDFSQSSMKFSYRNPATLKSVTPTNGPLSGGTFIVINGEDFHDSSKLMCRFTPLSNSIATSIDDNAKLTEAT